MTTITNLNWQPVHLENELVRLVPLQSGHFEALFAVASDPLIWEQHPASNRYQREVFEDFFAKAIEEGKAFLIVEKATNQVVGSSRYYEYDPAEKSICIGYTFLGRAYWGGNFNKSIKKLMIDYAFELVEKVVFHIGADNKRSQIATMRIGAKKTKEMEMVLTGKPVLHVELVIEKKDWQA
ncbi:hypothetical protein SAMN05421780_111123 [Flexibacter flexilis DSM 6793]|uniref:N-acetyltransferase domain-containing protein n=1 Tax=Flexibacter flexilis DSM 6793 TaxID=927664 RepID=A0A1I1MVW5_9BACT|nr:GNAT family N-acetyltransferase [Flexibacter flexilis]SFC89246.1 hypothetical protein SAMN05421780_111123 [Flexibacter flexilis DSM 6793]